MNQIEVCLSPDLLHLYSLRDKVVVVTDILRATSAMVTALAEGMTAIKPVSSLEECRQAMDQGYLGAAERGGKKVEGFPLGNSPFDYENPNLKGKKLCLTTTNGTLALQKSRAAAQIYIGAFLNLSATAAALKEQPKDTVVVCAGWKGQVNMEDSLYAGALVGALSSTHETQGDSALMAQLLYDQHRGQLANLMKRASHTQRLASLGVERDTARCLEHDRYAVAAVLQGEELVVV